MDFDFLQIAWAASGLLYGITLAAMMFVISNLPPGVDATIRYLEWTSAYLRRLSAIALVILLLALGSIWVYATVTSVLQWYVAATVASVLGLVAHFSVMGALFHAILSKLRD